MGRTPRLTPAACSLTRFFRIFYGQRTSDRDVLRIQRTPSWCQPKFIILGDGVELLRMTGWNCTTLSLSPTRTSTGFGLAGISCFPRLNQTSQWTWLLALLTRLQDVVCLLPHASQWNLPDTVEPAIEKSQNNNRAELELHGLHGC